MRAKQALRRAIISTWEKQTRPRAGITGGRVSVFRIGYGSAKTKMLLPRLALIWLLPPAATATYCLPPTMYDTAGALTPAPQLYFHNSLPLLASKALNQPLASPLNTRLPAVASVPPISGCGVLTLQPTLPVSRFTATNLPDCSSPGMVLNAPPSHSLPL